MTICRYEDFTRYPKLKTKTKHVSIAQQTQILETSRFSELPDSRVLLSMNTAAIRTQDGQAALSYLWEPVHGLYSY